jgi:hypothetical protein
MFAFFGGAACSGVWRRMVGTFGGCGGRVDLGGPGDGAASVTGVRRDKGAPSSTGAWESLLQIDTVRWRSSAPAAAW